MSWEPLVSVILATYNDGEFLREAVETVLSQSYRQLELIVVVDGSTDQSDAVLAAIDDQRMRVFRIPNSGVSYARNYGIERARGEVICFQDGDDRYRPEKCSQEVELMRRHPEAGVVFGDLVRFNADGPIATMFEFMPELAELEDDESLLVGSHALGSASFSALIAFNQFPTMLQSMAFRREVVGDIRFRDVPIDGGGRILYDEISDFSLRVINNSSVAWHRHVVAEVRRHGANMSALVKPIEVAKLNMLEALRSERMTEGDLGALNKRIAVQRLRASEYWLSSRRSIFRGISECLLALEGGRRLSALKAMLQAPLVYLRGEARGL